jgi:hypothetical protein
MAALTKTLVNDSPITATVTLRDEKGVKKHIFIQPMSRVEISSKDSIDPITFNKHPRVKVL